MLVLFSLVASGVLGAITDQLHDWWLVVFVLVWLGVAAAWIRAIRWGLRDNDLFEAAMLDVS